MISLSWFGFEFIFVYSILRIWLIHCSCLLLLHNGFLRKMFLTSEMQMTMVTLVIFDARQLFPCLVLNFCLHFFFLYFMDSLLLFIIQFVIYFVWHDWGGFSWENVINLSVLLLWTKWSLKTGRFGFYHGTGIVFDLV